MQIFRISKYECYLLFKQLSKVKKTTTLPDFKSLITQHMTIIDDKIGTQKQENLKAEENIQNFKQEMADKLKKMLSAQALLNLKPLKEQAVEEVTP